jgi:diguanylate cyclase (GGDEF)-like protein
VREDANEARKLIYGIVAANVATVTLLLLFGVHMLSDATKNLLDLPPGLFAQNPRLFVVGTIALYLDVILVILMYETLSRLTDLLFVRVLGALAFVLWFDAVFFATGGFVEKPEYLSILASGIAGKALAAVFYASILTSYLRLFEGRQYLLARRDSEVRDIFEVLTFRQSYEALREHAVRDSLTRLYNASFLHDVLPGEVERAQRFGRALGLVVMDVDGMSRFNTTHGREQGDRALVAVGAALTDALRTSDLPARYDSDAFVVLLPDAERGAAVATAERCCSRIAEFCRSADPPLPGVVSVSVGVACYPHDGGTAADLLAVATRRMTAARIDGGNRVVAS